MSINLNKFEELFRYRKSGKMKIWRKKIWQLFFRFNPGDGFIMGRVNRNEGRATFVRKSKMFRSFGRNFYSATALNVGRNVRAF